MARGWGWDGGWGGGGGFKNCLKYIIERVNFLAERSFAPIIFLCNYKQRDHPEAESAKMLRRLCLHCKKESFYFIIMFFLRI
jgi:hypothetical protein